MEWWHIVCGAVAHCFICMAHIRVYRIRSISKTEMAQRWRWTYEMLCVHSSVCVCCRRCYQAAATILIAFSVCIVHNLRNKNFQKKSTTNCMCGRPPIIQPVNGNGNGIKSVSAQMPIERSAHCDLFSPH